jgi:hypothetical protein
LVASTTATVSGWTFAILKLSKKNDEPILTRTCAIEVVVGAADREAGLDAL